MITHFAHLVLNTVSLQGVKQFYYDQLQLPIIDETEEQISFQPTDHFILTFQQVYEPLTPVHIAFEVPSSTFEQSVEALRSSQVSLLRWGDGREIDAFETGKNVYFRDGDGNLLELISHHYVMEGVLEPQGNLRLLYLREVGFPIASVPAFRTWLVDILGMRTARESEQFSFAIGGTAHCVLSAFERKWIPIAMSALPPKMRLTIGVSDQAYLDEVRAKLQPDACLFWQKGELVVKQENYELHLQVTDFDPDTATRLNLPSTRFSSSD